jgi:hypothetical protein
LEAWRHRKWCRIQRHELDWFDPFFRFWPWCPRWCSFTLEENAISYCVVGCISFYVVSYSCDVTDAFMRQADTTFPKRYCAMPTLNVKLSLIGWFESASANGHRAYIEVGSWQNH